MNYLRVLLFAKNNWKPLLSLLLIVLFLIIAIPIVFVTAIFPSATPDFVEYYKDISDVTGISWVDMLVIDTVRRDNNFENITYNDIKNTALDFMIIHYKQYKKIKEKVGVDENGKPIYKIKWVLKKRRTYKTRSGIKAFLNDIGINLNNTDIKYILSKLKSMDRTERYDISISIKNIDDLINYFSADKKEWAYNLISSGAIPQIYGERIELPDHIEIASSGLFVFPTPTLKTITSPFGWRVHPFTKEKSFHAGVDISGANAYGQPVIASADGIVTVASYSSGNAGNWIEIKHKDGEDIWTTRYMHLATIKVKVGDKIKQGDVIGAVGNTGRSTKAHLHFELSFNGQVVNPLDYIR